MDEVVDIFASIRLSEPSAARALPTAKSMVTCVFVVDVHVDGGVAWLARSWNVECAFRMQGRRRLLKAAASLQVTTATSPAISTPGTVKHSAIASLAPRIQFNHPLIHLVQSIQLIWSLPIQYRYRHSRYPPLRRQLHRSTTQTSLSTAHHSFQRQPE